MKTLIVGAFLLLTSTRVLAQEEQKKATNEVYTYVEQMPVFPGGQEGIFKALGQVIQYPTEALQQRLAGKVFVSFVVGPTGRIQDVKVARSVHPLLDYEAVRAVQALADFTPGRQLGRAVSVAFTLPITFQLPKNVEEILAQRVAARMAPPTAGAQDTLPATAAQPIYTAVEKMPVFPGGQEALYHFIVRNLRYPEQASAQRLQGRVFVSFVVNTSGQVEQIRAITNVHPVLEEEAKRVVSLFPAFEPGQQSGRKVAVSFTVPISFHLNPNNGKIPGQQASREEAAAANLLNEITTWQNSRIGYTMSGLNLQDAPPLAEHQVQEQLRNFDYPTDALRLGLQGRVRISFSPDSSGRATNARILQGLHPALDQAALLAVVHGVQLKPAQLRALQGKMLIVSALFQLPPRADELLAQRMGEEAVAPNPGFSAAQYPGGPEALYAFLAAAPYPEAARQQLLSGRIFITITLDASGWVKSMEPLMSTPPSGAETTATKARGKALDELYEAAMQYLTQMPQWQPARWNGQPGPTSFTLPLTYYALPPATPAPMIYAYADEMPVPVKSNILQASSHRLNYPPEALRAQAQGLVWVYFVVDETGKVTQPVVVKTPHASLSEEALKLVAGLPVFKPGRHHGQPVKVALMLPVTFAIK
ncbi:TonB family protein [Hymenobacter sp. BT730]|uniref:TonB family protein n=1 Tax=Hymenobacter sp. BT730 TaxID=3063332 RepID=UPI0026E036AC|nr:TonB family protein [Hymenobacter sp. BT730]